MEYRGQGVQRNVSISTCLCPLPLLNGVQFPRDTSLTDPWSRMISYHFLNQTSRKNFFSNDTAHGAGQLFSQIPQIPAFQQQLTPFPILVADSRPVGSNSTTVLSPSAIVYEVNIPVQF